MALPHEAYKVINDPIHGHFEVPAHALEFLDTPHVQRLRELKQLGGTVLVYPGASHSRFEHSVGVSHLAASFLQGLYSSPRAPCRQFDNERHFKHSMKLVRLAGLCHDLGHGPFSHLFDGFLAARPEFAQHPNASHEARSVMLLENLVDEFQLDYDARDLRQISALITGDRPKNGATSIVPKFVYDVVANQTCGVDVDRFDYISRDVRCVGLSGAMGFDHNRLMKFAKVIGDNICYSSREVFGVYNLFQTRYQLHRTVYNHRGAIGIDALISDVLTSANTHLQVANSITDPYEFMGMTDCILHTIQHSKNSQLAHARKLVHRLRRRDLYTFVDEVLLPADWKREINPVDVTTHQKSGSAHAAAVNLVPDDIVLPTVTLNFGKNNQNPLDFVRFFHHWSDESPMHISSAKVSYVIPDCFEEKILRLYLRRSRKDPNISQYKQAAKLAFRAFIRKEGLVPLFPSPTPSQSAACPNGTDLAPPLKKLREL